ncbi:MAG: hypothetical protein KBT29_03165, partial [Prevotellaceae bacterium]|nr:hypothetical protein [Candidatus Minthosoma caballi]
ISPSFLLRMPSSNFFRKNINYLSFFSLLSKIFNKFVSKLSIKTEQAMNTTKKRYAFISYNHKDAKWAKWLDRKI